MTRSGHRWLVAAVVIAACAPYLPTVTDYFVQDDFGTVMILTKRSWTMFPRWFTVVWMENIWGAVPDEIRPFVAFSYQLTGKWAPHRPELHHAFNIALHTANALLVSAIARTAVGLSPVAAAFAGIVFAVLPSQAESAAWITGRVDSMPAFLYLATFLAYALWRQSGERGAYAAAVVFFFGALFSKQNAITMTATLAAYDLFMVERTRRGRVSSMIVAWVPFAVMTLGYLALRRVILGHAVRGGVQSRHAIDTFFEIVGRHAQRVTMGHTSPALDWEIGVAVFLVACAAFALLREPGFLRRFLCFCLAWWGIGVAPILVVGYESPRHVYLASAAWAFFLALIADAVYPRLNIRGLRAAAATAAAVLVAVYLVRLHAVLQDWHALARISKAAVQRMHDEALAAPQGTLFLVDVPKKSWEWGVPFVLQPPYQPEDLTKRIRLVTPWPLYCCGPDYWNTYARRELQAWSDSPDRPPVITLRFAPETGEVSRTTDADNPELRVLIPVLLQTDTPQALNGAIAELLERTAGRYHDQSVR